MSPKVVDGRIERIVDCASLIRAMPVALSQTGGEEAMTPPETRYAKSGDVRIAYQTRRERAPRSRFCARFRFQR